jgi:hypothetical protein
MGSVKLQEINTSTAHSKECITRRVEMGTTDTLEGRGCINAERENRIKICAERFKTLPVFHFSKEPEVPLAHRFSKSFQERY